ncbi:hypothetical protein [Mycobacterium sp. HUMS_1102779]
MTYFRFDSATEGKVIKVASMIAEAPCEALPDVHRRALDRRRTLGR